MPPKQKLLIPDYTVLRGTVIIDIHQNCSTVRVEAKNSNPPLTYHEIIGILESTRINFILAQSNQNKVAAEKAKSGKAIKISKR